MYLINYAIIKCFFGLVKNYPMSKVSKQSSLDNFFGTANKDASESLTTSSNYSDQKNLNCASDSHHGFASFPPALQTLHLPSWLADDYFSILLEFFHFSITFGYLNNFIMLYLYCCFVVIN